MAAQDKPQDKPTLLAGKRLRLILVCGMVAGAGLVYLSSLSWLSAETDTAEVSHAQPSSLAAVSPATDTGAAGEEKLPAEPIQDDSTLASEADRTGQLLDHFGLSRLEVHEDSIALNHSTRVIVENFLSAAPFEVLLEGLPEVEAALSERYGEQAAEEFRVLVHQYHDYSSRMAALDAELNLSDEITDHQVALARQMKLAFQEESFGYERSASLFKAEREMAEAMDRHQAEFDSAENLSEEDVRRMNEEYRTILSGS